MNEGESTACLQVEIWKTVTSKIFTKCFQKVKKSNDRSSKNQLHGLKRKKIDSSPES